MIIPMTISTINEFENITLQLKEFKPYDLLTLVNNSSVMIEMLITDDVNTFFTQSHTNKGIIINRGERFDLELLPQCYYYVRSNTMGAGSLKVFRKLNNGKNIDINNLLFVTSSINTYFGKKGLSFLVSWDFNINNYTTNIIKHGLENAYFQIDSGVLKVFYNGIEVSTNSISINLRQKNKFSIYYDGVNLFFLIDYGVKKEFIAEVRNIQYTNQKFLFSNEGTGTILETLNDENGLSFYDENGEFIWVDSISGSLEVNISPISFYTKDIIPLDYYSKLFTKAINGTDIKFIAFKSISNEFIKFERFTIVSDKKVKFKIIRVAETIGTALSSDALFEYYDDFVITDDILYTGYCFADTEKTITTTSNSNSIRINKGDVIAIIVSGNTALIDINLEFGV